MSNHWCRFCQLSIFLVLHLETFSPDDNFKKSYSESILNWLAILQKQIIGIFIKHFGLNRENVVKMSEHWWDESSCVCMPNMKSLSLTVQTLWPRLMFCLPQTDRTMTRCTEFHSRGILNTKLGIPRH